MVEKHNCVNLLDEFETLVRQDERARSGFGNTTQSKRNQLSFLRTEIKTLLRVVCDNVDDTE